jgi:hypothetical protein
MIMNVVFGEPCFSENKYSSSVKSEIYDLKLSSE